MRGAAGLGDGDPAGEHRQGRLPTAIEPSWLQLQWSPGWSEPEFGERWRSTSEA